MLLQRVLSIVESENIIQLIRMLLPEIVHNQEFVQIPLSFFQRLVEFLSNYLQAQIDKGRLRQVDVSLTAQVFIGSVMGFVLRRQVLRDPVALQYSHEQIADAVVGTVLNGVVPR